MGYIGSVMGSVSLDRFDLSWTFLLPINLLLTKIYGLQCTISDLNLQFMIYDQEYKLCELQWRIYCLGSKILEKNLRLRI